LGELVIPYAITVEHQALRRLRRLFYEAVREAERLGYRELAEAVRSLVHAGLPGVLAE
jgi:hypothetical protein